MKASQPGGWRRHVSLWYDRSCRCDCESILTVKTLFAKVAQDLRDDGVERVVRSRDRDVVAMRRGRLEVIDSVCIATSTAIATS